MEYIGTVLLILSLVLHGIWIFHAYRVIEWVGDLYEEVLQQKNRFMDTKRTYSQDIKTITHRLNDITDRIKRVNEIQASYQTMYDALQERLASLGKSTRKKKSEKKPG